MSGVTQNVDPQAMEDGRVTKSSNHAEEGELAEVEDCSGRKRPCQEEDHRGGCGGVKA